MTAIVGGLWDRCSAKDAVLDLATSDSHVNYADFGPGIGLLARPVSENLRSCAAQATTTSSTVSVAGASSRSQATS